MLFSIWIVLAFTLLEAIRNADSFLSLVKRALELSRLCVDYICSVALLAYIPSISGWGKDENNNPRRYRMWELSL